MVAAGTLEGLFTLRSRPATDVRGFFARTMMATTLAAVGIDPASFVQENQSRSTHRVLRGLHTRAHLSDAKLLRCAHGCVFEAVVDLRPWSSTFTSVETFVLDDVDHLQVYVPAGCAHGYQVLSDDADICYKQDAVYDAALEREVSWRDPELAIPWPLDDPILSERDRNAPTLAAVRPELTDWFGASAPDETQESARA